MAPETFQHLQREFLVHRAAVCGRAELLSVRELARVVENARGFSDALSLARRAMARLAFCRCAEDKRPAELPGEDVDRLLEGLEPLPPPERF